MKRIVYYLLILTPLLSHSSGEKVLGILDPAQIKLVFREGESIPVCAMIPTTHTYPGVVFERQLEKFAEREDLPVKFSDFHKIYQEEGGGMIFEARSFFNKSWKIFFEKNNELITALQEKFSDCVAAGSIKLRNPSLKEEILGSKELLVSLFIYRYSFRLPDPFLVANSLERIVYDYCSTSDYLDFERLSEGEASLSEEEKVIITKLCSFFIQEQAHGVDAFLGRKYVSVSIATVEEVEESWLSKEHSEVFLARKAEFDEALGRFLEGADGLNYNIIKFNEQFEDLQKAFYVGHRNEIFFKKMKSVIRREEGIPLFVFGGAHFKGYRAKQEGWISSPGIGDVSGRRL